MDHSNPEPAFVVTGRITVASSPRVRSALFELIRKSAGRVLVIDLSSVSHIDISGFATLLEGLNCAHKYSTRLRLAGVNGQPRRLAELAQLDEIFRAFRSELGSLELPRTNRRPLVLWAKMQALTLQFAGALADSKALPMVGNRRRWQ
jgi:anti-anti-sigma factor